MRKQAWVVAIGLVLSTVGAVEAAQAQQPPRYERNFTLTVELHWAGTVLAPGNYSLTLDPASPHGVITLRGEGRAASILPRAIARHAGAGDTMLMVKRDGELRIVEALYLADLDLVLYYHGNGKQPNESDAQRIERIPIQWIPQGACPEYCMG